MVSFRTTAGIQKRFLDSRPRFTLFKMGACCSLNGICTECRKSVYNYGYAKVEGSNSLQLLCRGCMGLRFACGAHRALFIEHFGTHGLVLTSTEDRSRQSQSRLSDSEPSCRVCQYGFWSAEEPGRYTMQQWLDHLSQLDTKVEGREQDISLVKALIEREDRLSRSDG